MTGELVASLTEDEAERLAAAEAIIERGLKSFVEVGQELLAVRDGQLYRASHYTFENYCAERWGFSRPRAYELMSSARVTRELSGMPDIPLPANQRQADELRGLPTPVAAEVMTEAAESGKVTAASIRDARERIAPKPEPRAVDDEERYRREARIQWHDILLRSLDFFAEFAEFDGNAAQRADEYDPATYHTKPATAEQFDLAADGLALLRKELGL